MDAFDTKEFEKYLAELLTQQGLELSADQLAALTLHARELALWNKTTNLTTITDAREMAEKHFADSLCALPYVCANSGTEPVAVLDVGSGGGFPAIPFAVACPCLQVVSVDSVRKKISFQQQVVGLLKLNNLNAVHSRVQELDKTLGYYPAFDCVISRAFAALDTFVELALPWLKPGGRIISYKSLTLDDELMALERKYPQLEAGCHAYDLPNAAARYVIVLENLPHA